MSKKYFEHEDSEFCYTEDYFLDMMREDGTTEMDVFLAQRDIKSDFFWCKEHGVACEKGSDVCGVNNCEQYEPRNGKNGICKHNRWCYTPIEKVTLKLYKDEN